MSTLTLREKLLNSYHAELRYLNTLRADGTILLETRTWNFTNPTEEEGTVHIDDVIEEVQKRIDILDNTECTIETVESLNYQNEISFDKKQSGGEIGRRSP